MKKLFFAIFWVISLGYEYMIPEYCSKDMSLRNIPLINDNNYKLYQAQVIIRHGARTPYTSHACWKGYHVIWNNCNVSEIMESSPSTLSSETIYWRFRLLYDAYPNQLGGNCLTGQLISEGYDQEVRNGEILRSAYIGAGNSKLFNTSVWEEVDQTKIYLRSDDEQRTLMSGQILIHSMFDLHNSEIVNWHTGDYILDTLSPNSFICPALKGITDEAENSPEYQRFLHSKDFQDLQHSLDQILGSESSGDWSWRYLQDCLMTTLCTGKSSQLPLGFTQELIDEAIHHIEYSYGYKSLYNNSEFSKLAIANTVYKIRTRIEKIIQNDPSALQFVLYGIFVIFLHFLPMLAGHDTTLSAILAALLGESWDQKWPPYASLLSIEIYQHLSTKKYYFRLIYNGDVLLFPGCLNPLCEVDDLLSALSFGRDGHLPECFRSRKTNSTTKEQALVYDTVLFTTGEWMLITTALSLLSSLLGAVLYMAAASQQKDQQQQKVYDRVPAHDQL